MEPNTEILVAVATPPKRKPGRPKKNPDAPAKPSKKTPKAPKAPQPKAPKGASHKDAHEEAPKGMEGRKNLTWDGPYYKINIISNGSVNPQFPEVLPVSLGDYPRIWLRANRELIVPGWVVDVLKDTSVDIPAPGTIKTGQDRNSEKFVRIPFQVFGTCTKAEYEDFKREDAKRALVLANKG